MSFAELLTERLAEKCGVLPVVAAERLAAYAKQQLNKAFQDIDGSDADDIEAAINDGRITIDKKKRGS